MGVETGIDLDALIGVSRRVQEIVGRALPGQIVKAGKWTPALSPARRRAVAPGRSLMTMTSAPTGCCG